MVGLIKLLEDDLNILLGGIVCVLVIVIILFKLSSNLISDLIARKEALTLDNLGYNLLNTHRFKTPIDLDIIELRSSEQKKYIGDHWMFHCLGNLLNCSLSKELVTSSLQIKSLWRPIQSI